jgi:hypothetical protein
MKSKIPAFNGIIKWVRRQFEALGTAVERKAITELSTTHWKDCKIDLTTWVGKLESIASKCGPNLPAGRPRQDRIRQLIMKNVGDKNPECAQVIRHHRQHEVDESGFSIDELVVALTKIMVTTEAGGEKQCLSFAVDVQSEQELQQQNMALLAEKHKSDDKVRQAERKAQSATDQLQNFALYTSKGGPKGGDRNPRSKGLGKDAGKSGNYCQHCAKFHTEMGVADKKDTAIRSHNTKDCMWFKKKPAAAAEHKIQNLQGVEKGNKKTKGGKGKGKGNNRW